MPDGKTHVAIDNIEIRVAIERWIRAMHAALYEEPLSPDTRFGIETPFTIMVPSGQNEVTIDRGRIQQHRLFVETIKHNRQFDRTDRVVSRNGKFRYECVWDQATNKNWLCIFAIDIYDWKNLGNTPLGPKKGCVGFYQVLRKEPPPAATRGTPLRSTSANDNPLDPFGG
jgi:hypothetical protein